MLGAYEEGQTYVAFAKDGTELHSEPRVKGKFLMTYLSEHQGAHSAAVRSANGNVLATLTRA